MTAFYNTPNPRQRYCVGWNVILEEYHPTEGISFSLSEKQVFTQICVHGVSCKPGQEVLYFLNNLIVTGHVKKDSIQKFWRVCFSQKGNKTVKFSDEVPERCSGFRLDRRGQHKVSFVPEKLVDYDDNGVPFTTRCMHDACDIGDKYMYALIRVFTANYINPSFAKGKHSYLLLSICIYMCMRRTMKRCDYFVFICICFIVWFPVTLLRYSVSLACQSSVPVSH